MDTWTSDSNENFEWGSNNEVVDKGTRHNSQQPSGPSDQPIPTLEAMTGPSNTAYEEGPSRPSLVCYFMGMGFEEEMVAKAIMENGEGDTEAILETLLTYKAIDKAPSNYENFHNGCSLRSDKDNTDDDLSNKDDFQDEEFTKDLSEKDWKLLILVEMGFPTDEASSALKRCGPNASVLELADSIYAAQMVEEPDCHLGESPISCSAKELTYLYDSHKGQKRRSTEETNGKRKHFLAENESMVCIPNPMIGFGLPNQRMCIANRKIPEAAIGPPYFYYENVALAPRGVWKTISRFLYDIEPEFVDSKYFCAAARKRGYVHNLPIHNRFPLLPTPPKTIQEAFPMTQKWWPSWDLRKQFNCLQTGVASAKLTERIRNELEMHGDSPPQRIQKYVLVECRRWNLVWVGQHKVAPLDPDEIELLLGFPRDHTRGGGTSGTERHKALGNSFQVDTVAYHLSVLKDMYPKGIKVLSLFSGIGGAEVALHRLGIHLKIVVSVEILDVNRNILKSWWVQTNQTGQLIDLPNVQELNGDRLEQMINTFGGFDLVIGGSPCNNLSGNNRCSRDGLEGKHSSLFYDYFRILDLVKCIMGKNL